MARVQLRVVEAHAHAPDGTLLHPQLLESYRRRAAVFEEYADNEAHFQPRVHAHFDLVLACVAAARAELMRLHREGQIEDAVLHELERDLDLEEMAALSAKAS